MSIIRGRRMFALAIPVAALGQCAPQQCAPPAPPPVVAPAETVSQQQARESARDYIEYVGGFSRLDLIAQLEYEGFSNADAVYAVDAENIDWFAQAAESARQYIEHVGGFSRQELIDQLLYEQFTQAEAEHGVNSVGL